MSTLNKSTLTSPLEQAAVRRQVAESVSVVSMRIGGVFGLIVLVLGVLATRADLILLGTSTSLVGLVGLYQRWRARPRPLVVLMIASGNALFAPVVGREALVALLPALTLLAFVAALSLPRRTALWFSIWCASLAVFSLFFLLPEATPFELLVAGIFLAAIDMAGWRFITMAGDMLTRGEERHRVLFQESPVAMLEEDYTKVVDQLEVIRAMGVDNLETHLLGHPEITRHLISLIRINRANPAAMEMIGVESLEDLVENFGRVNREDHELGPFIAQFLAIWKGRSEVAVDLSGVSFRGQGFEAVLHWLVPSDGGKPDFSRVIVTISDIAPRKVIEDRLATALDHNRRLLEFEHALAQCSRSLLMGSGEEALEEALATLRDAVGADRAHVTVNVDDPLVGPSSQLVRSVERPGFSGEGVDERVIPWDVFPEAREAFLAGRPFQGLEIRHHRSGERCTALGVPVFNEGRWVGTVGFMDINRTTLWDSEAIKMLEVAAPMLGSFLERENTRHRLEELVESKDRFLASVSHELRTPLAAILGFTEELKRDSSRFPADEIAGMLELIADQSKEMADMVEDLLVSARADIGTVSIRWQDVYLRSQAEAVLAGLGSTEGTAIRVVGDRGKVWADPARTRQILRNLITNAIRYGGSNVIVEALEGEEVTILTVIDDGDGLDASHWESIFEAYQRAHDATTQPASIGLGLTVSRQLARLMGGDLTYRCDERGSVFSLTLLGSGAQPGHEDTGELTAVSANDQPEPPPIATIRSS